MTTEEHHRDTCAASAARARHDAAMQRAQSRYQAACAVAEDAWADVWEALAEGAPTAAAEGRVGAARAEADAHWAEWERLRDAGPLAHAASLEEAAAVAPTGVGGLAGRS